MRGDSTDSGPGPIDLTAAKAGRELAPAGIHGYAGYYRQLLFEFTSAPHLVETDDYDAVTLPVGRHEVEIHDVRHTRGTTQVVFVGRAGRRIQHTYSRREWADLSERGAERGARCTVEVGWSAGCRVARTPSGAIAAIDPGGQVVAIGRGLDELRERLEPNGLEISRLGVIRLRLNGSARR